MPLKERFLYIALILVIGSYIVYLLTLNPNGYTKEYNTKIKELEKKVDSLHNINDELTFQIDTLNIQISNLDQKINTQNKNIIILKKQTNEKINSVNFFNDDELKLFFTNRYRQYNDTIKKTYSKISN